MTPFLILCFIITFLLLNLPFNNPPELFRKNSIMIDLFRDSETNLLPGDGTVNYFGKIFTSEKANFYLENLLSTIEWKNDEAVMFGITGIKKCC